MEKETKVKTERQTNIKIDRPDRDTDRIYIKTGQTDRADRPG